MLSIVTDGTRTCAGVSRREFLRVGALGGLTLPWLLSAKDRAQAAGSPSAIKDKSVVLLFLWGGAPHIETFDPKMTAPAEYRSMTGQVQTSLPGVTFGGTFPRLAKLAHKLAIIRSFRHGEGNHGPATELVITGGNPTKAALGSLYAAAAGASNPATGMPNHIYLGPTGGFSYVLTGAGSLGSQYAAFYPAARDNTLLSNMQLKVPRQRLDERRALLRDFDQLRRDVLDADRLDQLQQQAFDLILGGVADAFKLDKEDVPVLQNYDTSMFKSQAFGNESPVDLGRQLLMARRLCEAGCGFVTIPSFGWDMHGNTPSKPGVVESMSVLGAAVDKAVAAFLEDLEQRGLSERILLVITGEFGRTPKINKNSGRDHWGDLCTLALAGGGLQMGQVIGRSDDKAATPSSDPIGVENLHSTILHTLVDAGQLRLKPSAGKVNDVLARAEPIRQLF